MVKKVLNLILVSFFIIGVVYAEPQKIAENVYYFHADSKTHNSGWIELENGIVVVDAPSDANSDDFISALKEKSDKPIRFIIVLDGHLNRLSGINDLNQDGAVLVSHKDAKKSTITQIESKEINKSFQLPTMTFDERLVLHDEDPRIEIIHFGQGVTKGNSVVFLPEQKILFAGPLVSNGAPQQLQDLNEANIENWIHVLEELMFLDCETVVPVNGPAGTKGLIEKQRKYLVELSNQIRNNLEQNKSLDEIKANVSVPVYEEWVGQPVPEEHIEYVYQETAGLSTPWSIQDINLQAGPSFTKDTTGWTPPKTMLVRGLSEQEIQELKRVAPNMEFIRVNRYMEAGDALKKADALIGPIRSNELEQAENLRWVHSWSAGVEGYLYPEFIESDVLLTNGQGTYGPGIGDHVIGMTLMLTKGLNKAYRSNLEGEWDRGGYDSYIDLKGKTMLVLGLGGIGREVARRAAGFEMRVLGVDPNRENKPDFVSYIAPPDEMKSLLPQADVVVLCVPLTEHTYQYIDAECFDLMKDSAYLINIARGKVVNQEDMVAALQSGEIAGAALDVTDPEPLPEGHSLWKMDNVIITPHVAGRTQSNIQRRWHLLRENVRRFANGLEMLNVVDKEKGY